MVTNLRKEVEGLQLEIDSLSVTDISINRLKKEIKVRSDMLQSRQTFHTSIAREIGNFHEKIQIKKTDIQSHHVSKNEIQRQITCYSIFIKNDPFYHE